LQCVDHRDADPGPSLAGIAPERRWNHDDVYEPSRPQVACKSLARGAATGRAEGRDMMSDESVRTRATISRRATLTSAGAGAFGFALGSARRSAAAQDNPAASLQIESDVV
jgi:hypothetical protein